ncbi:ABC transporter permease [Liquorilactobacillus uvarum]|uniref:ABC transporter permease n=2 Tax=Liquorilactobacillus uvarum TaxID=303240 RepID=UPI00288A3955|nr:ABC transporter permease [Liquorilactobacillus uvarum]
MMTVKEKSVVFFLFKRVFRQLLYVLMWLLLGGIVFPMVLSFITGTNYNLVEAIKNITLGPMLYIIVGCLALLSYSDFKVLIQNGISRHTYWKAKIVAFLGISALSQAIGILYVFLLKITLSGLSWEKHSLFMQVYGGFFKNTTVAYLMSFLFAILSSFVFSLGCILTGSIFSLFAKKQRRLVILAILTLFIVAVATISNVYDKNGFTVAPKIIELLNFLAGYDQSSAGKALNPTMPFIDLIIFGLVSSLCSLQVMKRFKVRNE